MIRGLIAHNHVPFISELAGKLEFSVWARGAGHLGELLDTLIGTVPVGVSKTIIVRRWFQAFVITGEHDSPFEGYRLESTGAPVEIDETDHKILKAVCESNHLSPRFIGRSIGLPISTVEYRIRRLLKENVLLEPRYYVNASKLGLHRLIVRLRAESPSAVRNSLLEAAKPARSVR